MARTRSAARKNSSFDKCKENVTPNAKKNRKVAVRKDSRVEQLEGRVTRSQRKNEQRLNGQNNDQNDQKIHNKVSKQHLNNGVQAQSPENVKSKRIAKPTKKFKVEMASPPVFAVNDIVLVVWRFFPHWPAQIIDVRGKKATVSFFGSTENA